MVFSLVRVLLPYLCVTSALADLPPRAPSRTTRDASSPSGMINPIDAVPPSLPMKEVTLAKPHVSSSCIPQTGYIYATSDTVNGYLAARPNEYGGYATVTSTTADALQISFCSPKPKQTDPDAFFEINTLNGFEAFPLFGGVKGYYSTSPDLSAISFNYAYVAGTVSVPRGPAVVAGNSFSNSSGLTLPSEPVESFIWTITASEALLPA